MMNWNDLKYFVELARSGSVRATATKLQVSHSTVSRRVEALEKDLSVKLFNRFPEGFVLTAEGEHALVRAQDVENGVHGFELELLGKDARLSGQVKVTLPEPLASYFLLQHLPAFNRMYPDIDVRFIPSYNWLDLSRREADVAIRSVDKAPEHLIGRQLLVMHDAAYATREYLDRYDLDDPDSGACWLGWDDNVVYPLWTKPTGYGHLPAVGSMPDPNLQIAAAKAGMGIAWLPCFMGDPDPELFRLPRCPTFARWKTWILTHPELRTTERVRQFVRYTSELILQHIDLFEGRQPGLGYTANT